MKEQLKTEGGDRDSQKENNTGRVPKFSYKLLRRLNPELYVHGEGTLYKVVIAERLKQEFLLPPNATDSVEFEFHKIKLTW